MNETEELVKEMTRLNKAYNRTLLVILFCLILLGIIAFFIFENVPY